MKDILALVSSILFFALTGYAGVGSVYSFSEIRLTHDHSTQMRLYAVGDLYFFPDETQRDAFNKLFDEAKSTDGSANRDSQVQLVFGAFQNKESKFFLRSGNKFNDQIASLMSFRVVCKVDGEPLRSCDLKGQIVEEKKELDYRSATTELNVRRCRKRSSLNYVQVKGENRLETNFQLTERALTLTKSGTAALREQVESLNRMGSDESNKICMVGVTYTVWHSFENTTYKGSELTGQWFTWKSFEVFQPDISKFIIER